MAKIVGVLLKDLDELDKEYDEVEFERCLGNALTFCSEVYVQGKIPEDKKTNKVYEIQHGSREVIVERAKELSNGDWLVELNVHQIFSRIGIWGGFQEVCRKIKEEDFIEYKVKLSKNDRELCELSKYKIIKIPTSLINYLMFHISFLWGSHNLCRGHNPDRINEPDYFPYYCVWKPLLIKNKPGINFDNVLSSAHEYNKGINTSIEAINFRFCNEKIPEDKSDFSLHIVPDRFYPNNVLQFINEDKIFPQELLPFINSDEEINYDVFSGFLWKKKVEYTDKIEVKDFRGLI